MTKIAIYKNFGKQLYITISIWEFEIWMFELQKEDIRII